MFLPWFVLAPLPGGTRAAAGQGFFLALSALVPLALGFGLDVARGADPRADGVRLAAAWAALCLWSLAAERTRAPRRFAMAWFVLLPGLTGLRLALAWAPRTAVDSGAGPAWLAVDPWVFLFRWGQAEADRSACLMLVLGAFLAWLVARTPERTRGATQ